MQMIERSTKAFCVLNHRVTNEVDMRDLISQLSTEMHSNPINTRTRRYCSQVSSDGCFVGFVYGVFDNPTSDEGKVFVQIIDLRLLKDNSKHMRLSEDVAAAKLVVEFSTDLSILSVNIRIHDLLSTTDDMMAVPFSYSSEEISDPIDQVVFSPCNRYVCFLIRHDFKLYEICRSTRTLMELCVRGAKFSTKVHPFGKFHPNLPILLLGGRIIADEDEHPQKVSNRVFEVDLSTLEAIEIPPPHSGPRNLFRMNSTCFEFSSCGRLAWINSDEKWYQIPRSYSLDDERLIDKIPSVWQRGSVIYDQKGYHLTTSRGRNFILLELQHRMDERGNTPKAHVRITSVPPSMKYSPPTYLLPGHEEEDLARVLFVSWDDEEPAVIKLLPVTMKQILAKLDEIAEASDTQTDHDSETGFGSEMNVQDSESSSKAASESTD